MKPIIWSNETAKKELARRLKNAVQYRMRFEGDWAKNEALLNNTSGMPDEIDARYSFNSQAELELNDIDNSSLTVGVNYAFKNYRYIHSQLCANPPTVIARPTSSDPQDKTKADSADRLIKHALRAEQLQEKIDIASAKTLEYGIGWMKTWFDPNDGDIVGYDKETGEFELEGKIKVYSPSTHDVWLDPDARCWAEVRFIFERLILPLEEAIFLFPEHEDVIRSKAKSASLKLDAGQTEQEIVEIYEYWEKGMPINGMVGRHALHLKDGDILGKLRPNPFAFTNPDEPDFPPTADLPYHIFTDIDIADEVYGRSFLNYEGPIQDIINRLDNLTLECVQAVGSPKLLIPETSEITEMTSTVWDVTKYKGTQPPHFMEMPRTMPETTQLRDRLKMGGDDMAGVNDAMFGQMSRETSGFSLQYASSQGSLIRKRLFNKYQLFVESIYKGYLNLVRKHWKEPRIIKVLGVENSFEAVDFKGSDIDGGFDIIVEYGMSLSLDPVTRREEILQLMPLFREAGVDLKHILSMLRLNDLEGLFDIMKLARQRQKEIFDEMIASGRYIAPRELAEHKGMLDYAYFFITTKEFDLLPEERKALLERHIHEREQFMAQQAGGGAAPAGAPGLPPAGGMPPVPGM